MSIPHRTVGSGAHHVFVLHGWFGSADGWGLFPDYLDGQRFSYHFTDNRGYGARMGEPGDYTLDEVAGDVLALADELGADTFSLIGHSMGGAEVLRVLALAPERVRKIVAITPVGATPTPFDEAGHDLFYGAADDPGKRFGIIDFTTGNRNTATWVQSVVDWSLAHSTTEGFAGALVAWATPDFLDEVAGCETPILVIPGEHDPALGRATVEQTYAPHFPNCTIEVMPNAGHYPMFETPVQLATVVERFLAD
ncbi:MAG TPA: alpha/beta hydrolase [Dermatophilaceae bacterium]|nr:alpha/beta hydrolase [Dermatophilaceae bacterium]